MKRFREQDGSKIRWREGRCRFRPAAQPGRGGRRRGCAGQLGYTHLLLLQHVVVLLGLQERVSAVAAGRQGCCCCCCCCCWRRRRRRKRRRQAAAASAPAGGAPVAGLPLDRSRAARLLLGRRHGLVAGLGLLLQTGLSVVRAHAVLRAGSVGAGPDPELQVVRPGLRRRRDRGRGGAQQKSHGGSELAHLRQGQVLCDLHLDLACLRAHPSDGTSVEVRGRGWTRHMHMMCWF